MAAPMTTNDRLADVRWTASLTLAVVMAGHVMLETGVDALFLAHISVERLPFVTIAIALLALAVSRLGDGQSHRRRLAILQLLAAAGTLGFWFLIRTDSEWVFYLLYVWKGLITSLIVVRFWLLLGDLFTIGQGKKRFASIAMGGSVGALVGSGAAAFLAPLFGGPGLLLLASVAFAASALGPLLSLHTEDAANRTADSREGDTPGWAGSLRALVESPYACRVAVLVMVGGMTLTLGDFMFKSVLTEEVASEDLATWLSRIYLGLNILSIAVLAFGTTPIVRWLGVDRSLIVLPSLVGVGALGLLLGGALGATIFVKLADGTLRYSLHKTATELLYLPMTSGLRLSVKSAIDLVGQSGAKALASIMVLGLVALPDSRTVVGAAVLVFSLVWILLGLRLRRAYLDVFRHTLGEGMIETVLDHPELDLESAGSLIRALSDPDERRSLAAMRLLHERGQCDLIPNLILYHPSPRVVVQALDLFSTVGRDDARYLLDHLVVHSDARVRAAAVRAMWAIAPDVTVMREQRESDCLVVRVSASAGLLLAGEISSDEHAGLLREAIEYELPDARLAAAVAARLRYHPVNREALIEMATDSDPEVAQEAVLAIRGSGDEWFIPRLVDLLDRRGIREGIRRALIDWGQPALDELAARLGRPETPTSIQTHIPRTIARFDDLSAARILLDGLARVESGQVRFKLLRGLESLLRERPVDRVLRASASLRSSVDLEPLRIEFDRTLKRSLRLLALERDFMHRMREQSETATVAGELLVDLMRDKRSLATGRLFMMLDLLHPREDFQLIRSGLIGEDKTDRASAQELVETLLDREVADALLALARGPSSRAASVVATDARAEAGPAKAPITYSDLLGRLLTDASHTLRAVALYHAEELGYDAAALLEVERRRAGARRREEGAIFGVKDGGLAAVLDLFERRSSASSKPVVAS